MKTADRCQKTTLFTKRAGRNHFIANGFRPKTIWASWVATRIKEFHHILGQVTMLLFTTTLFLGAFYLFLVQLAEHGW